MSVWRIKAIFWLLVAALVVYPLAAQAEPAARTLAKTPVAATTSRHPSITRLNPIAVQTKVPSRLTITAARAVQVSTFVIKPLAAGTVYQGSTCDAWPTDPQVLAAFQYSADLWGSYVASTVPITIDACWTALGSDVLAATSPNAFWSEVNGAPSPNIVYPSALANALEGSDQNGPDSDMTIMLNDSPSGFSWFFGTTGAPTASQIDFATTAFHEIAHGLGFYDSTWVDGGIGSWGYVTDDGTNSVTLPGTFDTFVKNHSGALMTNGTLYPNPSTALGNFLASNDVYFNSPSAAAKLFSPSPFIPYTSIGHLDTKYDGTANGLMAPYINLGQLTHDPGTILLCALKDMGWSVATPAANQVTLLPQPVRVVDTRTGSGFQGAGQSLQGYSSHRRFVLAGRGEVPANATAVLVNLTAVGYPANGWLSAYPACTTLPATSNVNFDTRENSIANFAIVKLGTAAGCQGAIDVTGATGTKVIVDVTGYLVNTTSNQIVLLSSPRRVVDTRVGSGLQGAGTSLNGYADSRRYTIGSSAGVPANATAVLVNLTAVGYPANGWLSAYPACTTLPATSNVNFDTRENSIANFAIVKLGTAAGCQGAIDVTGATGTKVIVDVTGYLVNTTSNQIVLLSSPQRIVDTRTDSGYEGEGRPPQNTSDPKSYLLGGHGGVPASAVGVIANLTTVGYGRDGWVAAYPTGGSVPATSSVNFDTDENAISNTAIVRLGTAGKSDLVASAPTNAIIDVSAYLVR